VLLFIYIYIYICYWDSTVGVVTKSICWATKELCFDFWQGQEIIVFSITPSMALKSTQLSNQWGLGLFSPRSMKLTTHLQQVQRLRMSGAISPFPSIRS